MQYRYSCRNLVLRCRIQRPQSESPRLSRSHQILVGVTSAVTTRCDVSAVVGHLSIVVPGWCTHRGGKDFWLLLRDSEVLFSIQVVYIKEDGLYHCHRSHPKKIPHFPQFTASRRHASWFMSLQSFTLTFLTPRIASYWNGTWNFSSPSAWSRLISKRKHNFVHYYYYSYSIRSVEALYIEQVVLVRIRLPLSLKLHT